MALLKDTIITGSLRVTDTTYTTDLILSGSKTARYALIAPTSDGAPTFRALTNADVGLGNVENTKLSTWTGTNKITTLGTISTGTWQGTTVGTAYGGTGNTSFTQWGVIYANPATKLVSTAAGTSGYLLQGNGSAAPSWIQATNTNTASTIVKRDASGNFSAGTITAALSGNATTATTASYLSTPRETGYHTDEWGNFIHNNSDETNFWCILNNAGHSAMKVYFETGAAAFTGTVTATGFTGPLTGNAATATALSNIVSNQSASDVQGALQAFWNAQKSTMPRDKIISFTSDHSGRAMHVGYFINGYDSNPYGGFFTAFYNTPYYSCSANGTFSCYELVRNDSRTYSINVSGSSASCTGNAATATSAGKWTTARTLTIGNKGQSVNGSGNVSWALQDILIRAGNEFNFTASGIEDIWFNYKNQSGSNTTTKITGYHFGNGQGSTANVTLNAASFSGNASTATRINGNLGSISDSNAHNIWVSSGTGADGIPKYISGVTIVPSSKTLYINNVCCTNVYCPNYTYHLAMQNDGNLVIYSGSGGAVWSTGTSTKYVKENINSITDIDISNFMRINPVSFNYKPEMNMFYNSKHYGVIAEELLDIYPNLVEIPENYDQTKFDINKGFNQPLIRVNYEGFIPLLIKMVQKQQKEIEELREKLIKLNI